MQSYKNILLNIKEKGEVKKNRTGIDTRSITGAMFEHDMRDGFPLMTLKKTNLETIAVELEFFLQGMNDKAWLKRNNCNIWNSWCNPKKVPYGNDEDTKRRMAAENDLGEIYGVQWRAFNRPTGILGNVLLMLGLKKKPVDQLSKVVETLKTNPLDRRMLVTAWNPEKLEHMALPPCHYGFQFISDGQYLDLLWNQRSVDTPLGLPFNIASYGLLLELMARTVDMKPRKLIGFLADVHYYVNQEEGVNEILKRDPRKLPTLSLPPRTDILTWRHTDLYLHGYLPHPFIKIPIAV